MTPLKLKRSKSPQRVLMERLHRAGLKPRAWAVALALEGYARFERGTGRRISSLYHDKIAAITGMSVANVRRSLRELTTGPHPLYRKRNATGRQHTIYGNNDWELTTSGAIYEWIDDMPNVATQLPQAMPQARNGASARRGYKPTARCLTTGQIQQFATDMQDDPSYGDLLPEGQQRIAEYHALRHHVIDDGCERCQVAVAREIASRFPEDFVNVRFDERCRCGELVVRDDDGKVLDLWAFAAGNPDAAHRCDTSGVAHEGSDAGSQG